MVIGGLGAALAWAGPAAWLEAWGRGQEPAARADLVVVAGCSVEPGGRPSPCLAARVDAGVALWRRGHAERLLLTGGVGEHAPAEAVVAAAYARTLGVPTEALRVEAASTSTEENARLGVAQEVPRSVIVVTDAFHQWRAQRCFAAQGVEVSGQAAEATWDRRLQGALREVLVVAYDAWTGRCAPPD